jgi:diacylglycerol kinase family enzyme
VSLATRDDCGVRRVLIVNPFATGVTEELLGAVRSALPRGTELLVTTRQGQATEMTREAVSGAAAAVYVFGGDGTFNEVLNGVDGDTPIGLIPGGGTSVLPRALGLPREAVEAARRVASGTTRRIGVGRVNGHRFGFGAGIGLDAEIVRAVDALGREPDGRRPGDLAFGWTAARTLAGHRFRIEPALEVHDHGRAAFALVANCSAYSYAGPLAVRVAPEASFEGGLDLVAPRRLTPFELARVVSYAFLGGDRRKKKSLLYAHDADRLEVRCDRPLPLQADGEDLGDVEQATFEAERDAIAVLV